MIHKLGTVTTRILNFLISLYSESSINDLHDEAVISIYFMMLHV